MSLAAAVPDGCRGNASRHGGDVTAMRRGSRDSLTVARHSRGGAHYLALFVERNGPAAIWENLRR